MVFFCITQYFLSYFSSREKNKKSKSQEADKFLNLKIHPLHDSDPPPGFRGVWGYQEYQVSLQMCSRQQQAALHDEIPYHRTSTSYYSSTLPYIALILKGKECKASLERAQGQRAAHKGRGSHLSTVVPLHIYVVAFLDGSPIHCLQDQYLCSYNYRLL